IMSLYGVLTTFVLLSCGISCASSGEQVSVSASIGIHLSDGTESPEILLLRADQAMYVRKKSGKAGISLFELTGD
ncbi:diguanylate cyclase, partial [Marinobacter sp.]|uniref:diguanylate cyclase domain-containing protein n=1 Tax=Marinobacter sp. TaxID=50741 RepID=UPI0019FE04D2